MTEVAKHLQGPDTAVRAVLRELFVINLCASMTPMPEVPKNLKGFEKYKLYQICKVEDGRRRYRLRLGFFHTEMDAQLLVSSLRSMYPAALAGCALEEDMRHAGEVPATANRQATVVKAAAVSEPSRVAPPAPRPAPVAAPPSSNPPAIAKPAIELKAIDPPAATRRSESSPSGIYHVGRGVTFPETSLELSAEELAQPLRPEIVKPAQTTVQRTAQSKAHADKPVKPNEAVVKPATPVQSRSTPTPSAHPVQPAAKVATNPAKPTKAQPIVSATIQAPKSAPDDYVPILDTTLTIRTLTKAEAEDPNRPKWFAVQLAVSEEPINVSTMPKLDIFSAYSLYSVALMESGSIRHTLRLGFFKEKVSAEAVLGYLKTFFNEPTIAQISSAEHDRFSSPKPAKTQASVSQIDERRSASTTAAKPAASPPPVATTAVRNRPAVKPVAPPAAIKAGAGKQQSFLSRLIGKQLD